MTLLLEEIMCKWVVTRRTISAIGKHNIMIKFIYTKFSVHDCAMLMLPIILIQLKYVLLTFIRQTVE